MDALTLLKERRSIRKFKKEKVSREVIREVIETARFAPSWANFQIARYTVVEDEELKNKICSEGYNGVIGNMAIANSASGVVILSYVNGKSGHAPATGEKASVKGDTWSMFDAGIAALQFCLAAYEKGVGTVIQGLFNEEIIGKLIGLPDDEIVAAVIPYGYEETHPNATPRKSVDEIARFK